MAEISKEFLEEQMSFYKQMLDKIAMCFRSETEQFYIENCAHKAEQFAKDMSLEATKSNQKLMDIIKELAKRIEKMSDEIHKRELNNNSPKPT